MSRHCPWLLTLDANANEANDVFIKHNYDASTVDNAVLMGAKPVLDTAGVVIKDLEGCGWKKIDEYHILPGSTDRPVVDDAMRELLISVCGTSEVEFCRTVVKHKSGFKKQAWTVIPQIRIPCTDLEQSVITSWMVPNVLISTYESIKFLPDCLGQHHIVRDSNFTSQILLSTTLKEAMEELGTKDIRFRRDYEIPPSYELYS